ncbi:hypothetical protein ACFE04_004233 [Oxalis oulophora]
MGKAESHASVFTVKSNERWPSSQLSPLFTVYGTPSDLEALSNESRMNIVFTNVHRLYRSLFVGSQSKHKRTFPQAPLATSETTLPTNSPAQLYLVILNETNKKK